MIAVHLAEGFEEIEAISIIDVLRRADLEVKTVSVTGQLEVNGGHGIRILADNLFDEIDYEEVEMIVLPGGMPGAKNLNSHSALKEQIAEFYERSKLLGAICAAPIVLGGLGILKNKRATCYPGFEDQVTGARITEEAVEKDGNIITGKGPGVALLFALKIVETLKGTELARELAKKMIVRE